MDPAPVETSIPNWEQLCAPFEALFTRPGFRFFCAFVPVLANLDGRLWVTRVALAQPLGRHWTGFHRFLAEGAWSVPAVAQQMWQQCLPCCLVTGADGRRRVFAAIDDTVCAKFGRHFAGLGCHHDPMNRQHPKRLSSGHCFVCLAALGQQTPHHVVALFVSCALYVQKAVCQAGEFQTKLVLAAQMLVGLPGPPDVRVCVLADGAYAKKPFVTAVRQAGRHVLSRLRSDTVFYDLPPARRPGQKGRPRSYGDKHHAQEWAKKEDGWTEHRLRLYDREAVLQLKRSATQVGGRPAAHSADNHAPGRGALGQTPGGVPVLDGS